MPEQIRPSLRRARRALPQAAQPAPEQDTTQPPSMEAEVNEREPVQIAPEEQPQEQPALSDQLIERMRSQSKTTKGTILKGVEFEEAVNNEIKLLRDKIKDNRAHMKEQGVKMNAFSHILRLRKMEDDVRRNFEEDVYIIKDACGMTQTAFDFEEFEAQPKQELEQQKARDLSPEEAGERHTIN